MFKVEGQVAVVTGGAQGIGAAIAQMLAAAGADVAVLDTVPVDGTAVDVTDESEVKNAFARIAAKSGGIDILINNAGRVARIPAADLPAAEWQAVLDVNLTATFLCSRTAHPYMKKRGGGSIVNVASIMGLSGGLFPQSFSGWTA